MTALSKPALAALVSAMNSPGRVPTPLADLRRRLEQLETLPVLPETGRRANELLADPEADVEQLVALVANDPNLAAQVLRWSNSPLYARGVAIDNLRGAVVRLGRDVVLNLALAASASRSLSLPREGVLGSQALWREAFVTANLASALARQLQLSRASGGVVYLGGLLHNLGLFLLGHECPEEYALLRRVASANPAVELLRLETLTVNVNHIVLGAWLLHEWSLPEAVVTAVREQRNPGYVGKHAEVAGLVCLARGLLTELGWVQNGMPALPQALLERLGCSAAMIQAASDEVRAKLADLDELAAAMQA